jgi:hypothetical protein
MRSRDASWDFFIAHSSADAEAARELYRHLKPRARTFLDLECLTYGRPWDEDLAEAQQNSAATIVLISSASEKAFYQLDEVSRAIAMARADHSRHRVIPVYLDEHAKVPYGLNRLHSLRLAENMPLKEVSDRLLSQHPAMPAGESLAPSTSEWAQPARTSTRGRLPIAVRYHHGRSVLEVKNVGRERVEDVVVVRFGSYPLRRDGVLRPGESHHFKFERSGSGARLQFEVSYEAFGDVFRATYLFLEPSY